MKITHYTTHSHGGAFVYAESLHEALLKSRMDSALVCRFGREGAEGIRCYNPCGSSWDRALERLRYSFENRARHEGAPSYYSRYRLHRATPPLDQMPDVVHLHWIGRWLDLRSFLNGLPKSIPVVWTVHDMSPLAGGCFTDFGCVQLVSGCRCCPLLRWPWSRIWARSEMRRRRVSLSGRRVAFVGNSKATMDWIKRSPVATGHERRLIYPGFDFALWKSRDRCEARAQWGLGMEGLVIGFGAADVADANKGFNRFVAVLDRIRKRVPDVRGLVVGHCEAVTGPPECVFTGALVSAADRALAFSAMDALIVPSRMESFGQVSVEAQACGVPVWVFRVGGLPETIENGFTGGVADFGDIESLASGVLNGWRCGSLPDAGRLAARWVRANFGIDRMANEYLELYRSLLR